SGAVLVAGNALHGASPGTLAAGPAVAVDGVEGAPELALLHLFNCCTETGAGLLLVARTAATAWPIELPDLASRLRAAPSIGIGPPDDALLAAVLVKHFSDRQIRVAPGLIDYLVPRME